MGTSSMLKASIAAMVLAAPLSVPATIQERAWSSPIWYTPEG